MKNIVITGGAGFIGSHVVRLFVNKYPEYNIICLDKLTYAGNLANLKDIEDKPNYKFVKMDICDFEAFYQLMQDEKVDGIIHLAAESHVDRSIKAHWPCCRLRSCIGNRSRKSMRASVSTISRQMRYMGHWN